MLVGTAIAAVTVIQVNLFQTPWVSTVMFVGAALMALALPAIYATHAQAAGWLGLVAHLAHLALEVGVFLLVLVGRAPLLNPGMRDLPDRASRQTAGV